MIYTVAEDHTGKKTILRDCRSFREDRCPGEDCKDFARCQIIRK